MSDSDRRRRLYDVLDDPDLSLEERQRRALALGREYLGVESGHVQRRDDGADTVVVSVGDDPDLLPEGTVLDRATTYCRRTVEARSPVALSNAPEQGWADDPAYAEHGFDCYLGTTVFVDGDVYGTVCFVSRAARATEFTSEEEAFVELLARLLGREIAATEYEARIERTERARERSRGKYEALLRLAPDAVFLADAETGELREVNDRAVALTGYEKSTLTELSVFDLHPPDERERYARLFGRDGNTPRDRFDDGTPLRIRRADGSDVPVEMSTGRVDIGGQRLVHGIVRDVSERHERERELERTREFLRQTQETVDLGGWEVDLETEDVRWTDEVYRIHGRSREYEPTVAEALDFYHPEDRSTVRDAFDRLVEAGEPYDLEVRIVTPEGAVRWVRTVGRPEYDDGTVVGARGVFQDISERRERERELRLKSRALEETTVGVTIADATRPDNPVVYANEGFTRLTGYPTDRVLGNNCRFLQGEDTDADTVADIRAAVDAEEPIQTEVLNYRDNGTPFWNRVTIAPVTGSDGERVEHYVGIQEDVTVAKRHEQLINVLDRVLRHNVRNEMNVVGGFADMIADRSDGETAALADRIAETAAGLSELSEKAHRFQTTVGETTSPTVRDLVPDVVAVVDDLRQEYPGAEFRVDGLDGADVIATDRLRLALTELGENAAKHADAPVVTYRVERTADGSVVVRVSDDGPGLPDVEQQVLEIGRETPLTHGSGIGLWLVNWIVTGFGGDVHATVDDGTTVTVRLPPGGEGPVPEHRDAALGAR